MTKRKTKTKRRRYLTDYGVLGERLTRLGGAEDKRPCRSVATTTDTTMAPSGVWFPSGDQSPVNPDRMRTRPSPVTRGSLKGHRHLPCVGEGRLPLGSRSVSAGLVSRRGVRAEARHSEGTSDQGRISVHLHLHPPCFSGDRYMARGPIVELLGDAFSGGARSNRRMDHSAWSRRERWIQGTMEREVDRGPDPLQRDDPTSTVLSSPSPSPSQHLSQYRVKGREGPGSSHRGGNDWLTRPRHEQDDRPRLGCTDQGSSMIDRPSIVDIDKPNGPAMGDGDGPWAKGHEPEAW